MCRIWPQPVSVPTTAAGMNHEPSLHQHALTCTRSPATCVPTCIAPLAGRSARPHGCRYDEPSNPLRIWDLWDNIDGSVERGYAGRSIFDWAALPALSPRYRDYARLLASVGINMIVWDNVNACGALNQHILEPEYLAKLAPLAELFASFGIASMITPCFTSPETVGKLKTSDPLDPAVIAWWKSKVAEVMTAVPSFRGFLSKADSEGQPGPIAYNRTEVDGANMFGAVLDPLPGLVPAAPGVAIWRSFSHPSGHAAPPMNEQSYFRERIAPWSSHPPPPTPSSRSLSLKTPHRMRPWQPPSTTRQLAVPP